MSFDCEYKFEKFEEYYGDAKQVKQIVNNCKICDTKLIFSHVSDYKNLIIQETSSCPECGNGNKKLIHVLN